MVKVNERTLVIAVFLNQNGCCELVMAKISERTLVIAVWFYMPRGWCIKFATELNIIIAIVHKVD